MIGKTLAHYEIIGMLGKGGMGEVYRARDTKLKRDIAMKILPPDMADKPDLLGRFQREAEAVARLSHPNIVHMYSVEEDAGVHFLTMELVEGRRLDQILEPQGLPLPDVLKIGVAVADALAAAHAKGIVHRDLKPSNVMVSEAGHVKVLDFGIVRLVENQAADDETGATEAANLTRDGAILGTIPYMAPEQLRGQDVDARSDLFSFGILLYELATGRRPFRGSNHADQISAILTEAPTPTTQLRPDVPAQLGNIVARCLEKTPERRFQSATDVCNALRELQNAGEVNPLDGGIVASGPVERVSGVRRRQRWVGFTIAAVVVVLFAVFLGRGDSIRRRATHDDPLEVAPSHTPADDSKSIAVMAFADMSPDGDQEYLSDGIAEELLNLLARIPDLKVISRSSAFSYKGKNVPLTKVAEELGVAHVLEGSVRKAGEHVRVSAQLIEAASDTQVWSETYDRTLDDLFAIQDDIAADVVEKLKVELLGKGAQRLRTRISKPTDNIEAYQAYLRGLKELNAPGFSNESSTLGVQMLERAVGLDPEFALAYATLSSINSRIYHYGFDRTPERLARAKTAADHALALDPDLPEGYLALGHYYYWGTRDYDRALAALDQARLNAPSTSAVVLTMAYVRRRQGDFQSAVQLFEEYRVLSPMDPQVFIGLGETYGTLRQYPAAEQSLRHALALAPDDAYAYTELGLLYLRWRGDTSSARAILEQAPPPESGETCRVGYLIEMLERDYGSALERLDACPDSVLEASAFYLPTALIKGILYDLQGEPGRARRSFMSARAHLEERLREDPADYRIHGALGLTYAGLGRIDDATRQGLRAVELHPVEMDALEGPVQTINLALIHTMVGQHEAAFRELDAALSVPSILSIAWLAKDPRWDRLRADPGFDALMQKHAQMEPGVPPSADGFRP